MTDIFTPSTVGWERRQKQRAAESPGPLSRERVEGERVGSKQLAATLGQCEMTCELEWERMRCQ